RLRSGVVRRIRPKIIRTAAIAAPFRLAGLAPRRTVRVRPARSDPFRRADARATIRAAISRQVASDSSLGFAHGRHLFFGTAALLLQGRGLSTSRLPDGAAKKGPQPA